MAFPLRTALVAPFLLLMAPLAAAQDPPPPPAPSAPTPPPPAPPAPPSAPQLGPPVVAPPRAASAGPARAPRRAPAPPRIKRNVDPPPPPGTPIASFPGFSRLSDGTTRIWVEVTRKVDVLESKAAGRVVYRLQGTAVLQKTNQLPLLTGFFATPVDRVQLVRQGADVDLIIELREVTDLTHRVVETPRGMVLEVDFARSASGGGEGVAKDGRQDDTPAPPVRQARRRRSQTLGAGRGAKGPVEEGPLPPVEEN